MKTSWNLKPLEELCNIQLGKTPERKTAKYWDKNKDTENVWVSISDMIHGKEIHDSKEYVSDLGKELFNLTPKGTLLLSFKLTIGRVSFAGKDLLTNEAIASLIDLDESILERFLYYYFSFFDWEKATAGDHKIKGKTLNKAKLKKLPIYFPAINEQEKIVSILDEAFEKIEQAKANIEQNIENAKELFESKLNKVCQYKEDSWEVAELGEVCDLFQGLAINAKTKHLLVEKSSLPLLRIKDLKNNTEEQFVSEKGYPEKSYVDEDDLIYTRTGSLGLVFRGRKGILHNNAFKVVPFKKIEKNYMFWWMQHMTFNKIIIRLATRAAQPDITHKLFKAQKIIIPSLAYQKKQYEIIEALKEKVDEAIAQYEIKLNSLDELKKSILQKAFSGELTNKTVEA